MQYVSLQYYRAEWDFRSSASGPAVLRQDQLCHSWQIPTTLFSEAFLQQWRLCNTLSQFLAVLTVFTLRENFLISNLDLAVISKPPQIWQEKICST